MRFFKWKMFIITSFVCLSPILLGMALWNKLPDIMAIHFNVYGAADNFASKGFVVYALPLLMVAVQGFCCFVSDINAYKHSVGKKLDCVTKWIIPCITVALQIITLGYGLGWNMDMRKVIVFIVAVIFLVIGNYIPKLNYVKNFDIGTEKARKINRFIGYETVIMGLVFLVSIFLPPISTVVSLFMLIPYTVVGIVYSVVIVKKH